MGDNDEPEWIEFWGGLSETMHIKCLAWIWPHGPHMAFAVAAAVPGFVLFAASHSWGHEGAPHSLTPAQTGTPGLAAGM